MKISKIIEEMHIPTPHEIINEKEFEIFALSSSLNKMKKCIFLEDQKYIDAIPEGTTMIITKYEFEKYFSNSKHGLLITDHPRLLFFEMHNFLAKSIKYCARQENTKMGMNCSISPLASISPVGVSIGDNVIIEEFVVIKENIMIGNNSIIRSGTVLGGQGFEFKRIESGILSIAHAGSVQILENVEIQHNCCVDRAVFPWDATVIEKNTKIGDLAHIAHAVKIGENNLIAAQAIILGRVVTEDNVWIGPGAIVSNGLHIGKNARVNIGSVVTKSVADGESVTGNFAISHGTFIRNIKELSKNHPDSQ